MPVVLEPPALLPKKEFWLPVVFELPAPLPANILLVPAMLKTRLPPMLYCVEVLMSPATSSFEPGVVVPMPTLPLKVATPPVGEVVVPTDRLPLLSIFESTVPEEFCHSCRLALWEGEALMTAPA